jgi:hypothetical protein
MHFYYEDRMRWCGFSPSPIPIPASSLCSQMSTNPAILHNIDSLILVGVLPILVVSSSSSIHSLSTTWAYDGVTPNVTTVVINNVSIAAAITTIPWLFIESVKNVK